MNFGDLTTFFQTKLLPSFIFFILNVSALLKRGLKKSLFLLTNGFLLAFWEGVEFESRVVTSFFSTVYIYTPFRLENRVLLSL